MLTVQEALKSDLKSTDMRKQYYKTIDGQRVWFREPLLVNGMQVFNPTEEMILADGWIEYIPPQPTPLEKAKSEKLSELDAYDASESVNGFRIGNQVMWLEPNERANYLLTLQGALEMGVETIPFMGYTIHTADAIRAIKAVNLYAMQCVGVTAQHRANIEALTTVKTVNEYDFTEGYPEQIVIKL